MSERHLAVVVDYDGLQRAMRARVDELGISHATLDEIAGTPDRYVGKMLADPPSKNIGITTMGYLLQALGLKLIVAEDVEQMAKLATRMVRRDARQVRKPSTAEHKNIVLIFTRRHMRKLGKLSAAARMLKLKPSRRRAIARKAARARWAGNRPKNLNAR